MGLGRLRNPLMPPGKAGKAGKAGKVGKAGKAGCFETIQLLHLLPSFPLCFIFPNRDSHEDITFFPEAFHPLLPFPCPIS